MPGSGPEDPSGRRSRHPRSAAGASSQEDLNQLLAAYLVPTGPPVTLAVISPDRCRPHQPDVDTDVSDRIASLCGIAMRSVKNESTSSYHLGGVQFAVLALGQSRAEATDLGITLARRNLARTLVPLSVAVVHEPEALTRAKPLTLMLRAWRLVRELGPGVSTEWDGLIEEDGSSGAGVRAPLRPRRPPGHLRAEASDPRDDPL